MIYFKVPVFTKLSRLQNILILTFQSIILIISITVSLYRSCSYESIEFFNGCKSFNIFPGYNMVSESKSVWQFLIYINYSSELLTKISTINYNNIYNTTVNEYTVMKGNIVMLDNKTNDYVSLLKEILPYSGQSNFYYEFLNNIEMNNEPYNIKTNDGILELMFINNCSNNSVLFEDNQSCFFKNKTYDNINSFLNNYFNETLLLTYLCNNCYKKGIHNINDLISVTSSIVSLFILFNSILILLFLFILSKIKSIDIGYIKNIIDENITKNNGYEKVE